MGARRRVRVKLVSRIDLQDLADKFEGRGVMKRNFVPLQRLMNVEKARGLGIRVARKRENSSGNFFEHLMGMCFCYEGGSSYCDQWRFSEFEEKVGDAKGIPFKSIAVKDSPS